MSQTYHSLLSFWKQLHVASLLEKKYCPCSFPPPVALRRFAALPSLGSGRDGGADRAGFTSLIGWPGTALLLKHWLKVIEGKNWMQTLEKKNYSVVTFSPSTWLPIFGWLPEAEQWQKCIFVVCDRLQRSKNSIYYISAAILCNGMLLGVWVALMCAPLGQIFPMKIAIKSSLARFKIYFTSK